MMKDGDGRPVPPVGSKAFSNFLTAGIASDLQIKCEGQSFSCHRLVVAANSPVLAAMLQSNMVEASSGTIEISDMKPSVLQAILEWIYKNRIETKDLKDDFDFAEDLIAAAKMYNMTRLKQICEDVLCDILAVDNVLTFLVIGDLHGAAKLKEQALKMIVEKKKQIVNLEHWLEFIETYPKLTCEITKML